MAIEGEGTGETRKDITVGVRINAGSPDKLPAPDQTTVPTLDEDLLAAKEALRLQATEMLGLLVTFEARLKARLDIAERRIQALRDSNTGGTKPEN